MNDNRKNNHIWGVILIIVLLVVAALASCPRVSIVLPVGSPESDQAREILKSQSKRIGDAELIAHHERILLSPEDNVPDWDLMNSSLFLKESKAWDALINVVVKAPRKKSVFIAAWSMCNNDMPVEVLKGDPEFKKVVDSNSTIQDERITFSYIMPVDPQNYDRSGEKNETYLFGSLFLSLKEKMEE